MNDIIDILSLTLNEEFNADITLKNNIFSIKFKDGQKYNLIVKEDKNN